MDIVVVESPRSMSAHAPANLTELEMSMSIIQYTNELAGRLCKAYPDATVSVDFDKHWRGDEAAWVRDAEEGLASIHQRINELREAVFADADFWWRDSDDTEIEYEEE